jgi:invasion protein IalB
MARFIVLIAAIFAAMAIDRIAIASDSLDRPFVAPSPWMKSCVNNPNSEGKTFCVTGAEAWNRVDRYILAAVEIIDQQGGKSALRVTLPPGTQQALGMQLTVDDKVLQRSPDLSCSERGCVSNYEADPQIVSSMRAGEKLQVQAVSQSGTPLIATLPLAGFAEAYDGPPSTQAEIEQQKQRSRRWLDDRRWPVRR